PNLRPLALLEVVAGLTLPGDVRPTLRGRTCQQRVDRHRRGRRRCCAARRLLLLDGNLVARLGRLLGGENSPRCDMHGDQKEARAQQSAKNLVEFERIHCRWLRRSAAWVSPSSGRGGRRTISRFAAAVATRISPISRG